jgi:hypothetical protein
MKCHPTSTHIKLTTGCPIGSKGYTLKREFAVALNTFDGKKDI